MKDVTIKIWVTKSWKFRARVMPRDGLAYEVTVGGKQWRQGKGCPYQREILDRCQCLKTTLAEILLELEIADERRREDDTISDGFGNAWDAICLNCGRRSMEVVRPGKVQCAYCG